MEAHWASPSPAPRSPLTPSSSQASPATAWRKGSDHTRACPVCRSHTKATYRCTTYNLYGACTLCLKQTVATAHVIHSTQIFHMLYKLVAYYDCKMQDRLCLSVPYAPVYFSIKNTNLSKRQVTFIICFDQDASLLELTRSNQHTS